MNNEQILPTAAESAEFRRLGKLKFAWLARESARTGMAVVDILWPTDEQVEGFEPDGDEAQRGLLAVQSWTARRILADEL